MLPSGRTSCRRQDLPPSVVKSRNGSAGQRCHALATYPTSLEIRELDAVQFTAAYAIHTFAPRQAAVVAGQPGWSKASLAPSVYFRLRIACALTEKCAKFPDTRGTVRHRSMSFQPTASRLRYRYRVAETVPPRKRSVPTEGKVRGAGAIG